MDHLSYFYDDVDMYIAAGTKLCLQSYVEGTVCITKLSGSMMTAADAAGKLNLAGTTTNAVADGSTIHVSVSIPVSNSDPQAVPDSADIRFTAYEYDEVMDDYEETDSFTIVSALYNARTGCIEGTKDLSISGGDGPMTYQLDRVELTTKNEQDQYSSWIVYTDGQTSGQAGAFDITKWACQPAAPERSPGPLQRQHRPGH